MLKYFRKMYSAKMHGLHTLSLFEAQHAWFYLWLNQQEKMPSSSDSLAVDLFVFALFFLEDTCWRWEPAETPRRYPGFHYSSISNDQRSLFIQSCSWSCSWTSVYLSVHLLIASSRPLWSQTVLSMQLCFLPLLITVNTKFSAKQPSKTESFLINLD